MNASKFRGVLHVRSLRARSEKRGEWRREMERRRDGETERRRDGGRVTEIGEGNSR